MYKTNIYSNVQNVYIGGSVQKSEEKKNMKEKWEQVGTTSTNEKFFQLEEKSMEQLLPNPL